jgi:DNA-binding response OmpR family regulator
MKVLVVEDHAPLRAGLVRALRDDGWAVDEAGDLREARWAVQGGGHDAVILDRRLPDGDGVTLLRELRQGGATTPVLLLTARDAVSDRVEGLDAGADDYVLKPFELPELLARLRRLTRRAHGHGSALVTLGDLVVDTAARTAVRAGVAIELSPKEQQLLEYLLLRRGAVVSRRELWDHLYDDRSDAISNVLDVLVSRLRRKLGDPPLIHTRRGLGYAAAIEP